MLADPTGQIERECADGEFTQASVSLTYALAIRDEPFVPVDWKRVNAAIANRWPKGLDRVKKMAWRHFYAQTEFHENRGKREPHPCLAARSGSEERK